MPQEAAIFDRIQGLLARVTAQEAEAHIMRLEEEIKERQAQQQKWRALLGLKQQLGEPSGGTHNGNSNLAFQFPQADPPSLREAILTSLSGLPDGTPVQLGHLRDHLIQRGWLADTKNDVHRLQVTASTMVKRGLLERPETGLYRLPQPDAAGKTGGGQG